MLKRVQHDNKGKKRLDSSVATLPQNDVDGGWCHSEQSEESGVLNFENLIFGFVSDLSRVMRSILHWDFEFGASDLLSWCHCDRR